MLPDVVHELDLAAIQSHLLQTGRGGWSLPQDDSTEACHLDVDSERPASLSMAAIRMVPVPHYSISPAE